MFQSFKKDKPSRRKEAGDYAAARTSVQHALFTVMLTMLAIALCAMMSLPNGSSRAYASDNGGETLKAATNGDLSTTALKSTKSSSPKINKKTLKLTYGKSATLKVSGNNGKKVSWKSSKKSIVLVKSTGTAKAKVTAKGSGTATITATVGGKKLKCKVSIPFKPTISKKSLQLAYGSSTTLKVSGNNGKKVSWKSSNTNVLQVKSAGIAKAKVTAKSAGTAIITANVGGKKLSCSVKVVGKLNRTSVSMTSFETRKLTLEGATVKSWSSSNENYVVVDSNGMLTPGGFEGTSTITCYDTAGNSYECSATVVFPDITCSMDKTLYETPKYTTYYYKYFTFRNSSGETISLADKVIVYFPYSDSDTSEVMFGLNNGSVLYDLDDYPRTVHSGYYINFEAFEGTDRYPIYSDGNFAIVITVGGNKYMCLFKTGGTLLACSPYSS